jgi:peptidoglycan/xylan/chitin deacetylase (PgdA/CDA1 family)
MTHQKSPLKRMSRLFAGLLILGMLIWPLVSTGLWIQALTSTPPQTTDRPIAVESLQVREIDQNPADLQPFEQPIITITFDDGWDSIYHNGLPLLQRYGVPTTQYIITSVLDKPLYMTREQVLTLHQSGHEIGSHTVTHPDLTTLKEEQIRYELAESQRVLNELTGTPITHLASPLSAYDDRVLPIINDYYRTHRNTWATVDEITDYDINIARGFSPSAIISFTVRKDTTSAELEALVDYAIKHNGWLVLTYHQVDTSPSEYAVSADNLEEQLQMITAKPVRMATIGAVMQAIEQRGMQ